MKCLICEKEDSNTYNHKYYIYVLLGFYTQWQTHIDMGGAHYENAYMFTPLEKICLKNYFCSTCKEKLFEKNRQTQKKSKQVFYPTLFIFVFYNLFIYLMNLSINYYFFNILYIIIILICIFNFMFNIDIELKLLFEKSNKFKEDIKLISKNIQVPEISLFNVKKYYKDNQYTFNEKNLLFIKQDNYKIDYCDAIGSDEGKIWFVSQKKGQITSERFNPLIYFDHTPFFFWFRYSRINTDNSSPQLQNFKFFNKKEKFLFETYKNKIKESDYLSSN